MSSPCYIGIEIGGTKLQAGLGAGDGTIVALDRRAVAPARGAEGVRALIVEAVEALREHASQERIRAVGVGFGGPVDAGTGVVTTSHQIEGWTGFPLVEWLQSVLGVPTVTLQNDADTAALAEARFGAGKGCSPLLYVTIGSGIGGGLILHDKIYRGAGAGAIEIGHLWVVDRSDSDLGVVTLEKAASGWAIGAAAREFAERHPGSERGEWLVLTKAGGDPAAITAELVAAAADEGDVEAQLLLDKATTAMAHGLCQAVTLLAPRRIILGGGVSLMPPSLWLDPISRKLDRNVFAPFRGLFDLVPAALGEAVVVHGALALARDADEAS